MSLLAAVSPTLADAVQSVGGTLARHAGEGHDVVVISAFGSATDSDDQISELLGLSGIVHVGLPIAAQRGYGSKEREGFHGIHESDHDTPKLVSTALAVALARLEPELVLCPLGLSGHIDAVIVGSALEELGIPRLRWLDLPYGVSRTPGATLGRGEVLAVPIDAHMEAKLQACALLTEGVEPESLRTHASSEGERLGAGEPVELMLRPGGDAAESDKR